MSERKTPPPSAPQDAVMRRIDRLLVTWPEAARSPAEWEDAAKAIVSGVESNASVTVAPAVRDEDLLRPPLPASLVEMQRDDGDRDAAKDRDDSGVIVLSELMASGQAAEAADGGHTAVARLMLTVAPAVATVPKATQDDAWIALGGAIAGSCRRSRCFLSACSA